MCFLKQLNSKILKIKIIYFFIRLTKQLLYNKRVTSLFTITIIGNLFKICFNSELSFLYRLFVPSGKYLSISYLLLNTLIFMSYD